MDAAQSFEAHRRYLFGVAYRMLGSASEAEDMVQDAYLRWHGAQRGEVRSPRAFLTKTVTRLCLDRLRADRAERDNYIGPWLPEPIVEDADTTQLIDPAASAEESAMLAESLSTAFLVLLERLNPVERAAFLLHDVFGYGFGEIAGMVGKSDANCRQAAHRARRRMERDRVRFEPSADAQDRLFKEFLAACRSADMHGLLALLAKDVRLSSDGGGKAGAARNVIKGAENVARFLVGIFAKAPDGLYVELCRVNGQPGITVRQKDGRPFGVSTTTIEAGRIRAIYIVVNPDKLIGVD